MSDEAEKRLKRTMDRLFHSPRPKPRASSSAGGMQLPKEKSGGKPNLKTKYDQALVVNSSEVDLLSRSLVAARSQEPQCRPWDRGDLLRRLATFKSMTWFAKPKVVSPIRCASRGWVNVDVDTISCDSCGARLLFSTPSAWSQHQVEKAAAVFSLKLDGGHKLLCPWIDNACDETLAQFPATTTRALVENYNTTFQSLSHISALPVILPSAIDYMQGHRLKWLLDDSSPLPRSLSSAIVLSKEEALEETATATLYYQAQKLISLCGWQPRSLPYVVDSEAWDTRFAKDINAEKTLKVQSKSIQNNVSLSGHGGLNNSTFQSDPASVVLDCSLCGASVGLWAFSTVRRPLEFVRLVQSAENNQQDCEHPNGHSLTTEASSSLTMSIGGGPPPTNKNTKAKVSLPIISRNLRSGLYSSTFKGILNNHVEVGKRCAIERKDPASTSIEEVPTQKEHPSISENQSDGHNVGKSLVEGTAEDVDVLNVSEVTRSSPKDAVPSSIGGGVENEELAAPGGCQNTHDHHLSIMTIDPAENHLEERAQMICEKTDVCCSNQLEANMAISLQEAISAKIQKLLRVDKAMQFDPIKQHRHFCPWIASANNTHLPGWELTLSALYRESSANPLCNETTFDPVEVDDIGSVQQLIVTPDHKKRKLSHISS